jgi:hypothetical protein
MEAVEVLEKQECVSPGLIMRNQRKAIEQFAWDSNYASDIIEIRS